MSQLAQKPDAPALTLIAWKLLDSNKLDKGIFACQKLNQRFPDFAEGWHVSSHMAQAARKLGKALEFIEKALTCESDNPVFLAQKASLLRLAGRLKEAYPLARKLVHARMSSPSANNILGATLSHFGLHEEALAAFDHAIAGNSRQQHYHFNRAAELRFLGRLEEAEDACNFILSLNPGNCEAYLLRSDLRKQTPENNHVAELEALLTVGIPDWRSEAQLRYALAKELEDMQDYERSFAARQAAARLRRSHMRYDVGLDIEAIDRIIDAFKPELFQQNAGGFESSEPIFILGLPRTGTTLLERVLEGHTDVYSAGELNNFATEMVRGAQENSGGKPSGNRLQLIDQTVSMDFTRLGAAYIDSTRPLTGRTPRFIDKLPLNYLYAGLIHKALPNAKIIHMRRHPLAACYAIYKQPFRDAYPFSYDLEELGHYYLAYDRLMTHWRMCIPDESMTEITYEDLVTNTEVEARRILSFCKLEWQSECLQFHRHKSASTTASAAQVRQPVYRTSLELWRAYERQLSPLIRILEDGGVNTGA